ncbi:UNVERIFIED_CONTAM: hypothetical protein GTU68_010077 [Idotea baltica]|nr:hypothetical protein [Idotea baltica]
MAGLLYLPRLFVYHVEKGNDSVELHETFCVMERKLYRFIMTPAMIITWLCGITILLYGYIDVRSYWFLLKFSCILALSVYHFWCNRQIYDLQFKKEVRSGRFYRVINEIPAILMVLIVVMVIVRPFG